MKPQWFLALLLLLCFSFLRLRISFTSFNFLEPRPVLNPEIISTSFHNITFSWTIGSEDGKFDSQVNKFCSNTPWKTNMFVILSAL